MIAQHKQKYGILTELATRILVMLTVPQKTDSSKT